MEVDIVDSQELCAKVIGNLERRGFAAVYAPTAGEAVEMALSFIPEGASVAWGGSVSVEESGLLSRVKSGNYRLFDRDTARTPEERMEIMRKSLTADVFLTSFNAVSEDGVLLNIDGNGNRVSAVIFGAESVVALVGVNKIVATEADLEPRALRIAAEKNARRLSIEKAESICAVFVRHRICRPPSRIKIILVGEDLGY